MENKYIKTENLKKLVTKEDGYHIHKIFGGITLINFAYQFVNMLIYGKTEMDKEYGLYLMIIHGTLSISSLIFHIPNIRNRISPMIYPEFRLHSIIFALRSIVCYYLCYYNLNKIYNILMCYLTMILADIATFITNNNKENTTMRNMPYDSSISNEKRKKITRFQSNMQISATLYMLGNTDTTFFTLYPIQLAAFLMTLVRKNIIDGIMWHKIYTILLIINVLTFINIELIYIIKKLVLYHLFKEFRFTMNINKYISWTIIFIIYFILGEIIKNYNIKIYNQEENTIKYMIILYYLYVSIKFI